MELNESRDWQCKQRTHKWTDRRKRLNRQKCAADVDGWAVQSDQPAAVTWPPPLPFKSIESPTFQLECNSIAVKCHSKANRSGLVRQITWPAADWPNLLVTSSQTTKKRGAQLSGRPIAGLKDHRPWPRSAPVSRSGRCRNYGIHLRVMRFRRTLTLTNGRFYLKFLKLKKKNVQIC